jgi:hypothetical protein
VRQRTTALAILGSLAAGTAMYGAAIFLTQYFQLARGYSPTAAGLLTIPMMAGILVASIVAGRLITRTGRVKPFLVTGAVLHRLPHLRRRRSRRRHRRGRTSTGLPTHQPRPTQPGPRGAASRTRVTARPVVEAKALVAGLDQRWYLILDGQHPRDRNPARLRCFTVCALRAGVFS